jgi:hypothetical protein
MGSLFDTKVYNRRNSTPWAHVSILSFMREMIWYQESPVILTANYRGDVASRIWYSLEWTSADGTRKSTSSQEFDLLMWRAAQIELDSREKMENVRDNDNSR